MQTFLVSTFQCSSYDPLGLCIVIKAIFNLSYLLFRHLYSVLEAWDVVIFAMPDSKPDCQYTLEVLFSLSVPGIITEEISNF